MRHGITRMELDILLEGFSEEEKESMRRYNDRILDNLNAYMREES